MSVLTVSEKEEWESVCLELVDTNSVCWAVVLKPGGVVCAVVEPDLRAGVTQRNHVKTGLEN